ncbi:MAG: hypothetical protein AAFR81_29150 [Chloroflexota bacterium]
MSLGTYVEIINYVEDTAEAGAYFAKLGLNKVAKDVYTDGRYHLRIEKGTGDNPTLRYYGSDLDAIKQAGLTTTDNTLTSPQGLTIELRTEEAPLALPHTDIMLAPDTTRLGKFDELTSFVADLETERAFWEKCGFTTGGVMTEPYNWGIWSDDKMLIGIHEQDLNVPFAITHFKPNIKATNDALKAEGFAVQAIKNAEGKSDLTYATLTTPSGIEFYLFDGDITKENP